MESQKNIMLILKKDNAFTLIEIIIATAIITFLIIASVSSAMILHNIFKRTTDNSVKIKNLGELTSIVLSDSLNADLFPHHPFKNIGDASDDTYIFNKDSIKFFANGSMVEYKFSTKKDEAFQIIRIERIYKFNFIRNFNVKYYDKKDFEIYNINLENPFYCIMEFSLDNKKTISVKMKL